MATKTLPAKRPVAALPRATIEYLYSDGKAMAESPWHVDAILYALATLRNRFADVARVQVAANMDLFYKEGDPDKKLAPDLFVVRGLAALPDKSYKVWEAGRPPPGARSSRADLQGKSSSAYAKRNGATSPHRPIEGGLP